MYTIEEHGFVIIPNTLSRPVCERLSKRLKREVTDMVFTNRGFDVSDLELDERCQMLVDSKMRVEYFGDESKISVWKNGNSRKPIHSKSCGMINIHYDAKVLKHVTLNKNMYENLKKVYQYSNLVHTQGFERVGIKPGNTPGMPQHIDTNPFYGEGNYDCHISHRMQSLITLNIDEDAEPENNGTLEVIPHFHRYFEFFSYVFHPENGIEECKMRGTSRTRFFTLPTGKNGWDKKFLPLLRNHVNQYREYLYNGKKDIDPIILKYYRMLKRKNVEVPYEDHTLKWTPLKLNIGDHVIWDERLPHRNVRNKTSISRIVVYYSLFPVDNQWYDSEERKWLLRQIKYKHTYYSPKREYNYIPINDEEIKHMDKEKISRMIERSEFTRKISGIDRW